MEGVGARFGRSSTRYGPATVFTGPVRRWKKKWVHVLPSKNSSNSNHSQNHQSSTNGSINGNNGSHLLIYKWTPVSQSQSNDNGDGGEKNSVKEDAVVAPEEPLRRKFKYVPIALLEELRKEASEDEATEVVEDESKPADTDASVAEPDAKNNGFDEKPDINNVPMDLNEEQESEKVVRQDLNESTLDLNDGV